MALTLDTFIVKRGDTAKAFTRVLKFSDGKIEDLTGSTVVFRYRPKNGDIPDPSTAGVERTCAIDADPTTGSCTFTPLAADTLTVGQFYGEFKVTRSGGGILTFPDGKDTYILFCVVQDVET